MKIVAIIQARSSSTRLPQKIIRTICGKTLLEHILERLQYCTKVDKLVVATTDQSEDRKIIDIAEEQGVSAFAGPTDDVLARFRMAAESYSGDLIIRICGDNPLIDPNEVDRIIQSLLTTKCDYAANSLDDGTLLILTGIGLAVEVMTISALRKADNEAKDIYYREHVTPYFYENPDIFNVQIFPIANSQFLKKLRLTVDTEEDFQNILGIFQNLYHPRSLISIADIAKYLDSHPYLYERMEIINNVFKKGR